LALDALERADEQGDCCGTLEMQDGTINRVRPRAKEGSRHIGGRRQRQRARQVDPVGVSRS